MKFWKALRWLTCALLLVFICWALVAGYRAGPGAEDPTEHAAPKFH